MNLLLSISATSLINDSSLCLVLMPVARPLACQAYLNDLLPLVEGSHHYSQQGSTQHVHPCEWGFEDLAGADACMDGWIDGCSGVWRGWGTMCRSRVKGRAVVWPDVSLFPSLLSLLTLTDWKAYRCQLAYDVTFYFSSLSLNQNIH